jgi:hypothetical protein
VDAHVHVHQCFAWEELLDRASDNFSAAARARGWGTPPGALMLTESSGVDRFGELATRSEARAVAVGGWTIRPTSDPCALVARGSRGSLVLVAGRQVVTREGLEVLLLCSRASVADGQTLDAVLQRGRAAGALRVIPWGAGKWLLGRGRLLRDVIDRARPDEGLFLGDSGGRPSFWGRPRHFARAEARGLRVLPGTDPLPFPKQVARPGSYGFGMDVSLDPAWPAEAISAALRVVGLRIIPFGRLERMLPFVRNQIGMQLRKRRGS